MTVNAEIIKNRLDTLKNLYLDAIDDLIVWIDEHDKSSPVIETPIVEQQLIIVKKDDDFPEVIFCQFCKAPMSDYRKRKLTSKSPDYRCSSKDCTAVAWLNKGELSWRK